MADHKIALITGGSRGIGLGIAKCLAADQWALAINGMRELSTVEPVLEELRQMGTNVIYVPGNIGEAEDRQRIVRETIVRYGQINLLVNNAGIAPKERNDLLNMSEESYDRVLNTNLKGPFFLSQLVANEMIQSKELAPDFQSYIVNISSISATVASINRGQYCISKAGLSMITQLFAARLGSFNIPVYEVRPGIIDTDMTTAVKGKYNDLIQRGLCIQSRWGEPEDVGRAVRALVRGDFSYSSGHVFMVDGGLTKQRL